MQDYSIRFYEDRDREKLLDLAAIYCKETGLDYNRTTYGNYMDNITGAGASFVVDYKDEPVGAIALISVQNPFNGKSRLHQADLYIHPDHRSKGLAAMLHAKAKECGELIGIEEYSWESKQQ